MKKLEYQAELLNLVEKYAKKLTVKQLRHLIAKYQFN
tara:strand:+ start:223 stop:333 length:111 start_codon:yes stop_codon:yes gene_type:complete